MQRVERCDDGTFSGDPAVRRGARGLPASHRPRLATTTYDDPAVARGVRSFLRACNPDYQLQTKGAVPMTGAPFMLHAR